MRHRCVKACLMGCLVTLLSVFCWRLRLSRVAGLLFLACGASHGPHDFDAAPWWHVHLADSPLAIRCGEFRCSISSAYGCSDREWLSEAGLRGVMKNAAAIPEAHDGSQIDRPFQTRAELGWPIMNVGGMRDQVSGGRGIGWFGKVALLVAGLCQNYWLVAAVWRWRMIVRQTQYCCCREGLLVLQQTGAGMEKHGDVRYEPEE